MQNSKPPFSDAERGFLRCLLTSTLREGFSTYSSVAVKALFDGIQVPHIFLDDHPIYPR